MASWRELILQAQATFADAGVPAGPDARLIAEYVSGRDVRELAEPTTAEPTSAESARFFDLVARRASRVPLQHVIGTMWFRYLELISRPGAFIVRPETEQVVEAALRKLADVAIPQPVVVDLCTGSGAIAISIATELPNSRVYGVEISTEAFDVARENNVKYGSKVTLRKGDARTAYAELDGRVDAVVTNPPYVPPHHELSPEVHQDPDLALYGGGDDGLDLPRELVVRAHKLLRVGGILVMEHAEEQASALSEFARQQGFMNVSTGRDLAGRERFLCAEKGRGNDAD